MPIAEIVSREAAEREVGTRLKRNIVPLFSRQRDIFKMGLAVLAGIYPYDHAVFLSTELIMMPAVGQSNRWHPLVP